MTDHYVNVGAVPFEWLLDRARRLAQSSARSLLGIAGSPGAGKSTLAARLVGELGDVAALLPMDGFHLAQQELARLGRTAAKGAPDTFDAPGYVSALRRLREPKGEIVYVPFFDRQIEEPIAGAIPLRPDVALIVTEGNYLLLDQPPWAAVRPLLDEAWFCALPDEERLSRLTERHVAFGKTPAQARAWALGSDQSNAALVDATRARADLEFTVLEPVPAPDQGSAGAGVT